MWYIYLSADIFVFTSLGRKHFDRLKQAQEMVDRYSRQAAQMMKHPVSGGILDSTYETSCIPDDFTVTFQHIT